MPRISVIIPVYNGEKTIRTTIQSVLEQSLSDFELLVVDDGSCDRTASIVSGVQDFRVTLFSKVNGGVSSARNFGIKQSSGKYLAFLDADDLWTTDKLACQLQALQQHPEAALAYSWTDYIDYQGRFLHKGDYPKYSGHVYENLLIKNFIENGSNPLVCKEKLLKVGLFDESFSYGEDWELWLRLAARFPFVMIPKVQILYRVTPKSASTQLSKMEVQVREVIERAFQHSATDLHYLKSISLSNFYLYLLLRSFETSLNYSDSFNRMRLYYLTLKENPSILKKRTKLMSILIAKIIMHIFGIKLEKEKSVES